MIVEHHSCHGAHLLSLGYMDVPCMASCKFVHCGSAFQMPTHYEYTKGHHYTMHGYQGFGIEFPEWNHSIHILCQCIHLIPVQLNASNSIPVNPEVY